MLPNSPDQTLVRQTAVWLQLQCGKTIVNSLGSISMEALLCAKMESVLFTISPAVSENMMMIHFFYYGSTWEPPCLDAVQTSNDSPCCTELII